MVFKAELGAVTPEVTQVQGVWMNPALRGQGLSAGYMAAVVVLAQTLAPVTSLYVNNFNTRARATYERVGFRQVGTFATVLFYAASRRQARYSSTPAPEVTLALQKNIRMRTLVFVPRVT